MSINIETTQTQTATSSELDILAKNLCGVRLSLSDSGVATIPVLSISTNGISATSSEPVYSDTKLALAGIGINVSSSAEYLRILDPNVRDVLLANNIGDGTGITVTNAASASIGEILKNNTSIVSFEEYKNFTAQKASSSPRADFSGCTNLERIDITGSSVCPKFENCTALLYFNGPTSQLGVLDLGSLTNVGNAGFRNCTGITDIIINNIVSTASNSFNGVDNVANIYAPDLETWLNCSFGTNGCPIRGSTHLYLGNVDTTSVSIPDTITEIKSNTFNLFQRMVSVTFNGTSLLKIGDNAFSNCRGLTTLNIPEGVTQIGINSFYYCNNLLTLVLPSTVTKIGDRAFRGCSKLTSITINATTPPSSLGSDVFRDTNNCPIYVPSASVSAYQSASGWSTYASRIQAIPT